ncbi:MAG: LPS-assembly protein LptD [Nitrospirota bacterium]
MGRPRSIRRALLAGAFFLLSGTGGSPAAAQPPDLGDLDQLRRSFQTGDTPVDLSADHMSYSREQDLVTAEGNVRLNQGGMSLTADRALLYRRTGRVIAEGRLSAREGEDTLSADSFEVDLVARSGVLTNGRVFLARDHYYITGSRIERAADESYRFERATITSCDPSDGRMPWKIRARRLRVEPERYLTARGVVFSVLDVPVLYLPYLLWPVKTERQTGLLTPHVGYSTREGLKIRQPVFITLGPSHDVTVTVDERTRRGVGGTIEYRYKLSRRSSGEVEVDVFRDREENRLRRRVSTSQAIRFNDRLELRISGQYLSDEAILRDLHTQTADRTKQFVESNLFLTYHDARQSATLLTRYTRDLANPDDDQTQLLPRIDYRLPSLPVARSPLAVAAQASYTNFWRRTGTSTQRMDAFPLLVWRQNIPPGVVVTPRLGIRETVYRRDDAAGGDVRRHLGVAGLGVSGAWDRAFSSLHHVVEPALLYTYVGDPREAAYPQFDEVDEIAEQNLVTATLTNRVGASAGAGSAGDEAWEPLWTRVTQSFRVTRRPDGEAWSPLRVEAAVRTPRALQVEIDGLYDHAAGALVSFDTDARVLAGTYGDLTVGRRTTGRDGALPQRGDMLDPLALGAVRTEPRVETEYYTILAHLALPGGFVLANKTYYNRQTRAYTEIDYGLLYRAQCWSVSLTYQDLPDRNEIGVMVTLVGATGMDRLTVPGLFDRPAQ